MPVQKSERLDVRTLPCLSLNTPNIEQAAEKHSNIRVQTSERYSSAPMFELWSAAKPCQLSFLVAKVPTNLYDYVIPLNDAAEMMALKIFL